MGSSGPTFYDDEAVFTTYMQHRQRPGNPNDTLEKPVMQELIGAPAGRRLLDLGCGDAALVASCWITAPLCTSAWKAPDV